MTLIIDFGLSGRKIAGNNKFTPVDLRISPVFLRYFGQKRAGCATSPLLLSLPPPPALSTALLVSLYLFVADDPRYTTAIPRYSNIPIWHIPRIRTLLWLEA